MAGSSMVWLQVLPTARGRDVDLPETIAHRSGGDAILFVPGHSLEITAEEWDYVKEAHADFLPSLRVLSEPTPEPT